MNMKKIILVFQLLALFVFQVNAQSIYGDKVKADVKMKYVYSFEEALKKAKAEKKLIFFNCFADWAIPCHTMNQVVFSDQEFSNWMDKTFVNLFMDVSHKEAQPLVQKYNLRMMAQYVVLDSEGNLVHRIVGGRKIPEFKALLQQSLSPKTSLAGMEATYEKGNRSKDFLRNYYDVLQVASEHDKRRVVLNDLFKVLKTNEWSKKENWKYFGNMTDSIATPQFEYLMANKEDFYKNIGKDDVNEFLSKLFVKEVFPVAIGGKYDANKFLDLSLHMNNAGISETDDAFTFYQLAKSRGEEKYGQMLSVMKDKLSHLKPQEGSYIDFSFSNIKSLSVVDKQAIVAYLEQQMQKYSNNTVLAKEYQSSIRKLDNKEGVNFENISFKEALAKAEKEQKLVFIDCYTVWCGPCKMLDENTFPSKMVGDYFRKNFVSLKIDMEKGEGVELAKKYKVGAFPTMLVLNADGTVKGTTLGYMLPDKLINKLNEIL